MAQLRGTADLTLSATETQLTEVTGDGTFLLTVDLNALADGDVVAARVYAPGQGGTMRLLDQSEWLGGQMTIVMPIFGPHANSAGLRYTLQQPNGTGKLVNWRLDAL